MQTFKEIQQKRIDLMTEKQKFMCERQKKLEEFGQRLLTDAISKSVNK